MTPGKNFGKDNYTIDLAGAEETYWQGTESGLLGAFQFDGACTAGEQETGHVMSGHSRWAQAFAT